jgi:hypothetical protein
MCRRKLHNDGTRDFSGSKFTCTGKRGQPAASCGWTNISIFICIHIGSPWLPRGGPKLAAETGFTDPLWPTVSCRRCSPRGYFEPRLRKSDQLGQGPGVQGSDLITLLGRPKADQITFCLAPDFGAHINRLRGVFSVVKSRCHSLAFPSNKSILTLLYPDRRFAREKTFTDREMVALSRPSLFLL